jgi:hypothetical protein
VKNQFPPLFLCFKLKKRYFHKKITKNPYKNHTRGLKMASRGKFLLLLSESRIWGIISWRWFLVRSELLPPLYIFSFFVYRVSQKNNNRTFEKNFQNFFKNRLKIPLIGDFLSKIFWKFSPKNAKVRFFYGSPCTHIHIKELL